MLNARIEVVEIAHGAWRFEMMGEVVPILFASEVGGFERFKEILELAKLAWTVRRRNFLNQILIND